ncbi:MAG TPA: Ig-like domain-containing protein [Longimicrobium sp.]|nr:Ig-like domain-containing protein [Longimicrobium sp.]
MSRRPVHPMRGAVAAALLALAACEGGGGGPPTGSDPVATVTVTAPASSVAAGGTLQLSAAPKDASGRAVNAAVTWSSTAEGIATVSASGLVTGVSVGTATIRAAAGGVEGSMQVSVTPAPVASVVVSPDTATLQATQTRRLTATARDAAGGVLTDRAVAWTALDPAVATVSPAGEVLAVAVGQARVVATVEAKADTAVVTVHVPAVARVEVSPRFAAAGVNEPTALQAQAFTADGTRVLFPTVSWTSLNGALTVAADGTASAAAPGVYRAVAQVNEARDTATIAVLGSTSLLSTAFAGGAILADARAGETVDVPVTLDLSRVSAGGDLGALQFEVRYDPAVLSFVTHTPGARGALEVFSPSAGVVRAAFAETAPQGAPRLTLVTLRLRVAAGAPPGLRTALTLLYTASPASTGFTAYPAPVVVAGRVRVVP